MRFYICLCMCIFSARALKFEVVQKTCESASQSVQLENALNPDTAYNIIYRWNRFGIVRDWQFQEDEEDEFKKNMHCVKLQFISRLMLPNVFSQYLSDLSYDVGIQKSLCYRNNILTELVHVNDVSVLSDFSAIEVTKVANGYLKSSVSVHYQIPWYFAVLKPIVDKHVQQSFTDRLVVLNEELCSNA